MRPHQCCTRRSVLPCVLLSLMCLCATAESAAQDAPRGPGDFSELEEGREIAVTDDTGATARGELLRFTPESLTMRVAGQERVFDRQSVTTVYGMRDSVGNGMLIGLLTGIGVGASLGAFGSDCGGFMVPVRPCDSGEQIALALIGGVLLGGAGLGIGTAIDALIPGRPLLYQRSAASTGTTVSLRPSLAASGAGLRLAVAW